MGKIYYSGEKYIGTKEIFNDDAYGIRNIEDSEVYEDEIINAELPQVLCRHCFATYYV